MPKVIELNNIDGALIVKFTGNFDEDTIDDNAPLLTKSLAREIPQALIFDFTSLEYVNSRGMGEIAEWYRKVAEKDGRILYFGASDRVTDLLEVVGFADLFEGYDNLEEAQKTL